MSVMTQVTDPNATPFELLETIACYPQGTFHHFESETSVVLDKTLQLPLEVCTRREIANTQERWYCLAFGIVSLDPKVEYLIRHTFIDFWHLFQVCADDLEKLDEFRLEFGKNETSPRKSRLYGRFTTRCVTMNSRRDSRSYFRASSNTDLSISSFSRASSVSQRSSSNSSSDTKVCKGTALEAVESPGFRSYASV